MRFDLSYRNIRLVFYFYVQVFGRRIKTSHRVRSFATPLRIKRRQIVAIVMHPFSRIPTAGARA